MELIIYGFASNKLLKKIKIDSILDKNINLMSFLLANKITIASSCNGEGQCRKCIVNNSIISCQTTLKEFIDSNEDDLTITISYL